MTHNVGLPVTVQAQIQRICDGFVDILGPHIAMVIHGSIALADFRLGESDLDLLVFCDGQPSQDACRAMAQLMLAESAHPTPIECSCLDRNTLRQWQHPAPFYFHYSEDWRQQMQVALSDDTYAWDAVRHDPDLTAHMVVAHHRGLWVYGHERLPLPDKMQAWAAIWYDIATAVEQVVDNPVYVVLNLCRTIRWIEHGEVLSKGAGGAALLPELTGDDAEVVAVMCALRRGESCALPAKETLQAVAQRLLHRITDAMPATTELD